MSQSIVVPILRRGPLTATLTLPWFLQQAEYHAHQASFQVLVDGEITFAAVHAALARAKKNICIICWGFQPSMYLIRKGSDHVRYADIAGAVPAQIGKLLEYKARQGVQVRVLCFASNLAYQYVNTTGASFSVGESQTPGRWSRRYQDRPYYESSAQYAEDRRWYVLFDEDQAPPDALTKQFRDAQHPGPLSENLHFRSRGFGPQTRAAILNQAYDDTGLAARTRAALAAGPSHHQKMILVDYDDPAAQVGFVMGHNLLDEYWDTNAHSAQRTAPDLGRNGTTGPREDFSSRVTGSTVGDLFYNFRWAWREETREVLPLPATDFADYKPQMDHANRPAMLQLLRTQPQYEKQDIKKMYLQAVNNVTSFIYIENQYFRWPPLAEKIKAAARAQKEWGRPDPVYLFVLTNSSDAGMGAGTVNTYRMLDSLGRADTMPGVARLEQADDLHARLGQALQQQYRANELYARSQATPARLQEKIRQELEAATAQCQALQGRYDAVKHADSPVLAVDQPGLKTHICSLVAMDSDPSAWVEVYIHAKLMIVNDAFLTLGSANINTRSMQVDSELNVAVDRPEIAKALRQELWGRHTNGWGGANPEEMSGDDGKQTFNAWKAILTANTSASKAGEKPLAPLREFLRTDPSRSNRD